MQVVAAAVEDNTIGLVALLVEVVSIAVVVNLQAACTLKPAHVQQAEVAPLGVV